MQPAYSMGGKRPEFATDPGDTGQYRMGSTPAEEQSESTLVRGGAVDCHILLCYDVLEPPCPEEAYRNARLIAEPLPRIVCLWRSDSYGQRYPRKETSRNKRGCVGT